MNGCVRRAWLTLGGLSMDIENEDGGWFCTQLDLGSPAVREVVNNRPNADGVDDTTRYMGGRVVSANITAMETVGARIDEVAASFGPFMVPSARPVLHYVLDRDDNPERTLTLRASAYTWPISGPYQRDIQLQWLASDPVARGTTQQSATAWAGSGGVLGRTYPLVFPRVYPFGSSVATTAQLDIAGDVPVKPYLRIYGPITNPVVTFAVPGGPTFTVGMVYRIDAGHFVGIDTDAHTAYLDDNPSASVLSSLDWSALSWPVLPVGVVTAMTITGTNTTPSSQVVATWTEGYLS